MNPGNLLKLVTLHSEDAAGYPTCPSLPVGSLQGEHRKRQPLQ